MRQDFSNVRGLMNDHGVVVMNDVRAPHTPGVSAAVWEAVADGGLIPIALSEQKFYGSWNLTVAAATFDHLRDWCRGAGWQGQLRRPDCGRGSTVDPGNSAIGTWPTRVEQWVPPMLRTIGAGRGATLFRPHLTRLTRTDAVRAVHGGPGAGVRMNSTSPATVVHPPRSETPKTHRSPAD